MLVTNARLATFAEPPELISDGAMLVEEGRIVSVGSTTDLTAELPFEERWDVGGQLVMPASICAHTHFYGAFARAMTVPGDAPTRFPEILERLWWRLDKALTVEDVRYSALTCLVDAIRHGTTTLFDHHSSPNAVEGILDVIADAVDEAGLRACLCYEVSDRDGEARMRAGVAENVRFARSLGTRPRPRLAASFGLHASLTLSDDTLAICAAAARGAGLPTHVHAAEGAADQEDALRRTGRRVIHRLADAGLLSSHSIAAHCVHIDGSEIARLAEIGAWVTHQPRSNMNNAVGVAPVARMLCGGVNVALGNDGFSNWMLSEMKTACLVHKLSQRDPRAMPADEVTAVAYNGGARLAQAYWPECAFARLVPGAQADFVVLDYDPPTPLSAGNLPWHLLFGVEASMITATVCAGRVLMRDRKILVLDESAIAVRSRQLAAELWRRVAAS